MKWFEALSTSAASCLDYPNSTTEAYNQLSQHVPQSFTIEELRHAAEGFLARNESIAAEETKRTSQSLLAVLTCLRYPQRLANLPSSELSSLQRLARIIADAIAPVITKSQDAIDDDDDIPAVFNDELKQAREQLVNCSRTLSNLGIEALDELLAISDNEVKFDEETLITILAFTDQEKDDWNPSENPETTARATRILEQQLQSNSGAKDSFITEIILQRYLRPLFSRSKPTSITSSGRKAEYIDSIRRGENIPDDTSLTKPWKYTDLRAVPAISWAVAQADKSLIAQHWPLYTPVLLTLADDNSTPLRRRGLLLMTDFLSKLPSKILRSTGLASVFEDAAFPTLAFLPSLTPDDASVQLLPAAYEVLRTLARKRAEAETELGSGEKEKMALLDKVMREGVFMGYFHAKEHVRVVEVLCRETQIILGEMGVHGVKHLKDLIPMLSAIMTDPFAPLYPPTLLSAVKALQAVLTNCWPRVLSPVWRDEIINALVLCWLHVGDHKNDKRLIEIEQELLVGAKALISVLKADRNGFNLAAHISPLIDKEPALSKLFGMCC